MVILPASGSHDLSPLGFLPPGSFADRVARTRDRQPPTLSVLDGDLQLHVAGGKPTSGSRACLRKIDDRELVRPRKLVTDLLPPELCRMTAITVDEHRVGAAAAFRMRFSSGRPTSIQVSMLPVRSCATGPVRRRCSVPRRMPGSHRAFSANASSRTIMRSSVSDGWRATVTT